MYRFRTAFPQSVPGVGPGPGPLKIPTGELRSVLGIREVTYSAGKDRLAIIDSMLG
jgi:Icc protein